MARAGEAPALLGRLSRFDTPYVALWIQALTAWAMLLVPGAGLGQLMVFREVFSWFFFAVTAAALMQLRRSQPGLRRPYRAPLCSPLICIVASVTLSLWTCFSQPVAIASALAFVALGLLLDVLSSSRRSSGQTGWSPYTMEMAMSVATVVGGTGSSGERSGLCNGDAAVVASAEMQMLVPAAGEGSEAMGGGGGGEKSDVVARPPSDN